jgi:hypothetical protein
MTERRARTALFVAAVAIAWVVAFAEEKAAPPRDWDYYKVISERSVFLRDRRPRERRAERSAPPVVRPPERDYVLTGVAGQGQERLAFIENTRTGETLRLRRGSEVAGGRITEIAMEHVTFEKNGAGTRVELGLSLGGTSASRPAEAAPAAEAEGPAPSPSPAEASKPRSQGQLSILERLRLKRQQELNKK